MPRFTQNNQRQQHLTSTKGQVAILFALIFTFMLILFALVVDFAHVIQAKINLQNAADAAAYSGAAYQARVLNTIGQINYRLKQNVKELAMRLYVTHLRHNLDYPRGSAFIFGGNQQLTQTELFICQQAHGYVSLSNIRYGNTTNLCAASDPRTGGIKPIVVPPLISSFDPYAIAVQEQIRQIQRIADTECRAAANDNRALAEDLARSFYNRSQFHYNQLSIASQFLNDLPLGAITSSSKHAIANAAYASAVRNLSLSDQDGFTLEILGPTQTSLNERFIKVNPIILNAIIPYYHFNSIGHGCVAQPDYINFTGMVGGVYRSPEILTYFGVKLTAKPKLLFMPQQWLTGSGFPTLTAYSLAKPFGSRIGPSEHADELMPSRNRINQNPLINFSFTPGDKLGMLNTKILSYLDFLHPLNVSGNPDGNEQTGWPDPTKPENIRIALEAIRAPTIFDALFFTIFPDPDHAQSYPGLGTEIAQALYPDFMEDFNEMNSRVITPQPSTQPIYQGATSFSGAGIIPAYNRQLASNGSYGTYTDEGPSSHSITTANMLPLLQGREVEFGFAPADIIPSGWAPGSQTLGRIGYSVKFLSFDLLMNSFRVTDYSTGSESGIVNLPSQDPNLSKILH